VLSVYLNVSPTDAGPAYLLHFRNCCKAIRAELPAAERDRFEVAVRQAERYLTEQSVPSGPGLALFASGEADYFYELALPMRPIEDATWGKRPLLTPLEEMLDDCERIGVALFDKGRARLFSIYLGAVEERRVIEDPVPGKQATGGWFALAQSRYARHHEFHVLQHAKHVIAALMESLRTRPFDRLFLAGPPEALAMLKHHLPRPLRDRLAGTLKVELFASDTEVLKTALEAADAVERREELRAVEELIEAATGPHVALGLKPTLAALNDGRVHRLFLAGGLDVVGGECETCGRLVAGLDRCPLCGGRARQLADLVEHLVGRAVEQGAKTEFVSDEAASLLLAHGGLGGWTRY
jgi:peptide subunit release factor 1 (eRF1)